MHHWCLTPRTPTPSPSAIAARVSINCALQRSRRLLRRHLLHLARGEIEAHALDLVEVGPGHAHEAGIVGIVDRMDRAVLIDAGVSGQQGVFPDWLCLWLFLFVTLPSSLSLHSLPLVCSL